MRFKLIIVFTDDAHTEELMQAARDKGATGATVITSARGEGVEKSSTFFGLALDTQRDVLLFLVEEHMSREILEHVSEIGGFDEKPGTGIAVQIDVEDAVGITHQIRTLTEAVEERL